MGCKRIGWVRGMMTMFDGQRVGVSRLCGVWVEDDNVLDTPM